MSIEWLRDLAICVMGFGVTLVALVFIIVIIMFYAKVRPVIRDVKAITKRMENISACVEEEVVRPIAQVAAFAQGLRQATSLFSRFGKNQ